MIQALPKLIKLNPIVVKEVFNRLLGTQHGRCPPSLPAFSLPPGCTGALVGMALETRVSVVYRGERQRKGFEVEK